MITLSLAVDLLKRKANVLQDGFQLFKISFEDWYPYDKKTKGDKVLSSLVSPSPTPLSLAVSVPSHWLSCHDEQITLYVSACVICIYSLMVKVCLSVVCMKASFSQIWSHLKLSYYFTITRDSCSFLLFLKLCWHIIGLIPSSVLLLSYICEAL